MKRLIVIRRFLRKPAVILGEIGAIAIAGALGASLPQLHVFQSAWFAALTLLAAASLIVVVTEQFRRARLQWTQKLSPAHFQSAPLKTEFERPVTVAASQQEIWSERRLGLAGSFVFHIGLLLLIFAGAWRALFATEAVVDLVEGETLAPASAWSAQWPGVFGKAIQLSEPITLKSVNGGRYADGSLRELRAQFSAGEIAVNRQLHFGGSRLYLGQEFGPSALLEWSSAGREAVLLANSGRGDFSGQSAVRDGVQVFVHSTSERSSGFEVRVMRGNALLGAGTLGLGESFALLGGESFTLRGAPMWARLHGSHDSALWLAYAGMILTMAGAAMMFCLIKLDFCIVVTPLGETEKVFVAMKPQRFAPLFQERFDEFVSELAGARTAESVSSEALGSRGHGCPRSENRVVANAVGCMALFLCGAFVSGCNRVSESQAKQLVERYNQVVSEAYRRGDVRLIDPVVGPNEGRKLTGLIGVRLDLGITLDSQLLSLEVTGVEPAKNELRVHTKERWSYRDLKIGTGQQVGEASLDSYEMVYRFTNVNKMWLVDEIKFAAPPQVGRTNTPWVADSSTAHRMMTKEAKP